MDNISSITVTKGCSFVEFLEYGFMQRALLAGLAIGIICPLIGIFIVVRRLSLVGDALAHVSMAGIALGLILGINPTLSSLVFILFAGYLLEFFRKNNKRYAEIATAIVMSGGLGLGVILISIGGNDTANIMNYLFGSIITITPLDLRIILITSLFILLALLFLFHKLFFISFDEEAAQIEGLPVNKINIMFILLTALTIGMALQVTGILLVSALITIPVATSLQLGKSFLQTTILAIIFALVSVTGGLISSFYLDWPPGGTIIVLALIFLLITILIKFLNNKFS